MRKSSLSAYSDDLSIDIGPAPSNEGPENQLEKGTGSICNSKYVNLRRSPIANGQVVDVLVNGDKGLILEKVPGFYRIKVVKNGKIGYVAERYFKED